jgi:hypothetical protein
VLERNQQLFTLVPLTPLLLSPTFILLEITAPNRTAMTDGFCPICLTGCTALRAEADSGAISCLKEMSEFDTA